MQLTTTSQALHAAARWVWYAWSRPAPPFISLHLHQRALRLAAAGPAVTAHVALAVDAASSPPGHVVVDGKQLALNLAQLPRGPLHLCADTQRVTLHAGKVTHTLLRLDPSAFPAAATPTSTGPSGRVRGMLLVEAVRQVATSAAPEPGGLAAAAVQMVAAPERLIVAATDGFRFAVRELPWSRPPTAHVDALLPAEQLAALVAPFTGEPIVQVGFPSEDLVTLTTPARGLTIQRAVHPRTPDVAALSAMGTGHPALMERATLLAACKQLQVYQRRPRHDRVTLRVQPGHLHLLADLEEVGRGRVTVDASYAGAPVTVCVRHSHLQQAARQVGLAGEDTVLLQLADASTPVWVYGLSPLGCRVLLAPLTLTDANQ